MPTRSARHAPRADVNHAQPGDPSKLAQAFMTLVAAKTPPLRLPLGSDTVARIEAKHAYMENELAAWRKEATLTDFTDAQA